MADDAARIEQLEAELRRTREAHAAEVASLRAENGVLRQREGTLVGDVERRDRALAESQAQQAATAEILRIIANAPADAQPVLDDVAMHAARLCDAADGSPSLLVNRGSGRPSEPYESAKSDRPRFAAA